MTYEPGTFRRPYRRGDYHLVDTAREGTYWRSPEGIVVRMASAESERAIARAAAPARALLLAALAGRLARQ